MIIKFNDPKCKCCPLSAHGFGGANKKVGDVLTQDETITLKPGVNVITKAQLEHLQKSPIFKHRIENRTYEIDEKISGESILGLNEQGAIDLVRETLDRNILRQWMKDEDRKAVREAIDAQLDKVKPEVKADGKTEPKAGAGART